MQKVKTESQKRAEINHKKLKIVIVIMLYGFIFEKLVGIYKRWDKYNIAYDNVILRFPY